MLRSETGWFNVIVCFRIWDLVKGLVDSINATRAAKVMVLRNPASKLQAGEYMVKADGIKQPPLITKIGPSTNKVIVVDFSPSKKFSNRC